MSETVFQTMGALILVGIGLFLVLKPGRVAEALKGFYSNYPLVRYAGERQLKSRNSFILILGVALILLGMVGLLSIMIGA